MILKIFAIFDKQVDAFMQPFFSPTIGAAIRSCQQSMRDDQSALVLNILDYTLYQLGEFDDGNGSILPMDPQKVAPLVDLAPKTN